MLVDVRWVVLALLVAGVIYLTHKKEKWAAPITVGVAVAGILFMVLKL